MEKARIVTQPYMIRHLALRILMAVERPWSPVFYVCIIFLIAIQKNVSDTINIQLHKNPLFFCFGVSALQRRPHQQNTTNGPRRPERIKT